MSELVPIWRGTVSETGKLTLADRPGLEDWLRSLAGARIELVIRPESEQRSLNANAYYHSVIVKLLADHCGYEPSEMHAALKLQFLAGKSTANLSRKAFSEYVEQCKRFAAELGVVIPEPGQAETL